MASREDVDFNAACFRGRSKAQMSAGVNLDTKSAAAAPPNSLHILRRDEGMEGEGLVARKLERRGLWNIDLNAAPPEVADCELTAEEGVGSGSETLPPPPADVVPDDSAKKPDSSDERELNLSVEMQTTVINGGGEAKMEEEKGRDRLWVALLGVAENALREKKEEEIRKRKRGASQEAELGGETAATRKRIGGQRRQILVEDWAVAVAAEAETVVARSTRGRAVAMPSKYRDSVLGAAAVAADLPRHNKSGKSATGFCTKRKSR